MVEWFPYRLLQHADRIPDQLLFGWVERDLSLSETCTMAQFACSVSSHADELMKHTQAGDRVLLLLPPGLDFAVCFMACLHAGRIAVPLYPPTNASRAEQVQRVIHACEPTAAWIYEDQDDPDLGKLKFLHPFQVTDAEVSAPRPYPIAFLQYTSGSVGNPKGVIITHDNLSSHAQTLRAAFGIEPEDVGLSWLPPYHDMGLIGCVLQPIWLGQTSYLMSPINFVRKPQLWLQALSKFAATVSGAPNFAYRWCTNLAEQACSDIDLASWRVAFCGAEPIQPQTLEDFAKRFADQGFQRRSFLPCYGLAETTLLVSGNPPQQWDGAGHSGAAQGVQIRIVDADQRPLTAAQTGEICVKGPSLSPGYWRDPGKTAERFRPAENGERWLRTGDLGHLKDGDLYVSGRQQDLLIIQGRNLFPEDVERIAYQHPELQAAAAIGQAGFEGTQELVLLLEFTRSYRPDQQTLRHMARRIANALQVTPRVIQAVRPGQLPRTTSGKIQRHAAKQQFEASAYTIRMAINETDLPTRLKRATPVGSAAQLWCEILGIEQVDAQTDWFATGGDSRKTAHLLVALEQHSGQSIDFESLGSKRTFADFAKWFDQLKPLFSKPEQQKLAARELSAVQKRLWLQSQGDTSSSQQLLFQLNFQTQPNLTALKAAWQDLLKAYPHFAYCLNDQDGLDWQETRPPSLQISDQDAATVVVKLKQEPLDPRQCGVWASFHPRQRSLVIAMHHLYTDGWAIQAALSQLQQFYDQRAANHTPELTPLAYAPNVGLEATTAQRSFWQAYLDNMPASGALPFDYPASKNLTAATLATTLDATDLDQLLQMQRQTGITPFVILSACIQLSLRRFCGSNLAILSAFANRHHAATARIAGPTFELAPLYLDADKAQTFQQVLQQQDARLRKLNQNLVDFAQLQSWDSHQALIASQVLLLHQYQPDQLIFGEHRTSITQVFAADVWLPLELVLVETPTTWTLHWRYQSARFAPATIAAMAESFRALLRQTLTQPQARVDRWAIKPAAQPKELFTTPPLENLLDLAKHPDHEAMIFTAQDQPLRMTFAQLDEHVSKLAGVLAAHSIGPGDRVAIHCQRDPELVIAILACLRIGAAFIPIPPSFPVQRARWILEQSQAKLLLTNLENPPILQQDDTVEIPVVHTQDDAEPQSFLAPDPQQLAYIIYTSGSSGLPKGVSITRAALAHFLNAFAERYPLEPQQRLLALTGESFDISLLEMLHPLAQAGTLVLADDNARRDGFRIADLIQEHRVQHMQATPATWRLWLQAQPKPAPDLTAYCGGERLDANLASQLQARVKRLINLYGPTEATIWAAEQQTTAPTAFDEHAGMPLGTWFSGIEGWISSPNGNITPTHGVGELYLSGPTLGQGYWLQPDITAASFLPHPYSNEPGARCYRTGDLVRVAADGQLRFLKRIDRQIKLRGFRIELGEIESQLLRHPHVEAAAVMQQAQLQQLEAHYESPTEIPNLRDYLAQVLPSYMLPTHFQHHHQLPLNASGKVDRRQLKLNPQAPSLSVAEDPLTQAVIEHYREVLQTGSISQDTSFFAAGGHSLKALELRFKLQASHGISPPMRVLFEQDSPQRLAAWLRKHQSDAAPQTKQMVASQIKQAPLLPSMQPIWLWQQLHPESSAYHLAATIDLPADLSVDHLRNLLDHMLTWHEALRLAFQTHHGMPQMTLLADPQNAFESISLSEGQTFESLQQRMVDQPFDLINGETIRIRLLEKGTQRRLIMVIHHLVCDGWSLALLLDDLAHPKVTEQTSILAIASQQSPIRGKRQARRWWQAQCARVNFNRSLPATSNQTTSNNVVVHSQLNPEQTQHIISYAQAHQLTPFALYLHIYQHLLAQQIAATDFAISVPIAQREASTAHIVGMFAQQILLPWLPAANTDLAQSTKALQLWLANAIDRAEACSYAALAGKQASIRGPRLGFWYQQAALEWSGMSAAGIGIVTPSDAIADLILEMRPNPQGGIQLRWLFDASLHTATQVQQLAQQFEQLLMQCLANGSLPPVTQSNPSETAQRKPIIVEAPQGQLEQQVATLWQQLLQESIDDRHADFFLIGGHSLLAMQLMSGLNALMPRGEISLQEVFQSRTIAQQAALLQHHEEADDTSLADMLDQLEQLSDEEARRLLQDFDQN